MSPIFAENAVSGEQAARVPGWIRLGRTRNFPKTFRMTELLLSRLGQTIN